VGAVSGTFTYDVAGRMTTRSVNGVTQTLTWDVVSNLTRVTPVTGAATTYLYDAAGQRYAMVTDSSATVFMPGWEATDPDTHDGSSADVVLTRYYAAGGVQLASSTSGGPLLVTLGDVQGSATVSIDPTGVATTNAYTPYGTTRAGSTITSAHGWLNQVADPTGLTYLNARYYDPAVARFVSPDPLLNPTDPRTLDPYRYANNNPTTYTDMNGLSPGPSLCWGFLGVDCPTVGQTISDNPIEAGMIDGAADTVVAVGHSFTPKGLQENWNAYAEAVKERGVVSGTNYALVGAPTDALDATLKNSIGCISNPMCIALPDRQYDAGYAFGQIEATVGIAAIGGATSFAIRSSAPTAIRNAWAVHKLPDDVAVADSRTYIDLTRGGSIRNIGTNATHYEFSSTLIQNGWISRLSRNSAVRIFEKDGPRYVLRPKAKSYDGWTANFTPAGSARVTLKLRLGYE